MPAALMREDGAAAAATPKTASSASADATLADMGAMVCVRPCMRRCVGKAVARAKNRPASDGAMEEWSGSVADGNS